MQSKGVSRVFSNTSVPKNPFLGARSSLWSSSLIGGFNWEDVFKPTSLRTCHVQVPGKALRQSSQLGIYGEGPGACVPPINSTQNMRGRHISGERVSRSFPRFLQVYTSHKRLKLSAQRPGESAQVRHSRNSISWRKTDGQK